MLKRLLIVLGTMLLFCVSLYGCYGLGEFYMGMFGFNTDVHLRRPGDSIIIGFIGFSLTFALVWVVYFSGLLLKNLYDYIVYGK